MYTTNELLTLGKMPEWADISLALYKEFSVNILFPKTFKYYLVNGIVIEVQFKEWAMKHLWGIQHIDGKIKNTKLFDKIDAGYSFADLSKTKVMKKRFMDNKDRIRMFACVYNVLINETLFFIEDGKLPGTDIKIDYIKSDVISDKGVHLGMRFEEGVYVPLTLLIDRAVDPQKTVKGLTSVKVMKLEIVENNQVIESFAYENEE